MRSYQSHWADKREKERKKNTHAYDIITAYSTSLFFIFISIYFDLLFHSIFLYTNVLIRAFWNRPWNGTRFSFQPANLKRLEHMFVVSSVYLNSAQNRIRKTKTTTKTISWINSKPISQLSWMSPFHGPTRSHHFWCSSEFMQFGSSQNHNLINIYVL